MSLQRDLVTAQNPLPGGALFFTAGAQRVKISETFGPTSKDQFIRGHAAPYRETQSCPGCRNMSLRKSPRQSTAFLWSSKSLLMSHESKNSSLSSLSLLKFTFIPARLKMAALSLRCESVRGFKAKAQQSPGRFLSTFR